MRVLAWVLGGIMLMGAAGLAPVRAADELVVRSSTRGVKDTIDELAKAVEAAGAKIIARVDHAAAAKASGSELRPTEVLLFGNPKLGTALMQGDQRIGLDLPMRVLAYTDAAGKTWVAYTKPDALKARYAIKGRDDAFAAMSMALDKLSGAAAGAPAPTK